MNDFGVWQGRGFAGMQHSFEEGYSYDEAPVIPVTATPSEILFAAYSYGNYEGHATVFFEQGGNLFEVNAYHCSCNGLERSWHPQPVTWAALALRLPGIDLHNRDAEYGPFYNHSLEARRFIHNLIRQRIGLVTTEQPTEQQGLTFNPFAKVNLPN